MREDDATAEPGEDGPPTDSAPDRQCAFFDATGARCPDSIPEGAHHSRLYCEYHKVRANRDAVKPKDRPPTSVKINIGAPKVPSAKGKPATDQERVEAAVVSYLQIVSGGFLITGDEVCAESVTKAAPLIAKALADLSRYHPQLVKILAPLEATGEGAAWIALLIATFPVAVTIAAHHKLIRPDLAEKMAVFTVAGQAFAASVAEKMESEVEGADAAAAA